MEETTAIANVYALLAKLWSREPDEFMLQVIRQTPSLSDCLPVHEDADLETLAVDYCQLFVGPADHLPPVQSVWETGQFRSDARQSVLKYCECLEGSVSGEELFGEFDLVPLESDHLATQLAVMARIVAAQAATDSEQRAREELAQAFIRDHLSWTEPLLNRAQAKAQTSFYKALILATREFLSAERQFWNDKCSVLQPEVTS